MFQGRTSYSCKMPWKTKLRKENETTPEGGSYGNPIYEYAADEAICSIWSLRKVR